MTKPMISFHNALTGEDVDRPMNDAEYAEYQILVAAQETMKLAEEQTQSNRASAEAKLAKLGLLPDEIAALL